MSDYTIGRDYQELRSRVERLEKYLEQQGAPVGTQRAGVAAAYRLPAGIDRQKAPILWKAEKHQHLPPFMNSVLGLPPGLKFDLAESQTWPCHPEPLILSVNWDAGGSDEFYRLQDQLFSLIRVTDSGITTATASYTATLVASGKAQSTGVTGRLGPSTSVFNVTLRDAGGGALASFASPQYLISCKDKYSFNQYWNFSPGLYGLVTGATWEIDGGRVDGC